MKQKIKNMLSFEARMFSISFILFLFISTQAFSQPLSQIGRLKVIGNQLTNSDGYPVQLRGVGTHGLQWFGNCINDKSIRSLVQDWKADILRLSMYPDQGGYEKDPVYWKSYADNVIEIAYKNGIYIILDWHMGMEKGNGDPWYWINTNNLVIDYFDYMSKKHGNKGNVLYELSNEPHDVGWERIKSYSEKLILVIRKNDPEGIIIVASPDWAARPDWITTPFTGEMAYNVMYSFHFYQHGESFRDIIRKQLNRIPIFITEWGGYNSSGGNTIDYENAQAWVDLMREKKISWTHWAWCDGGYEGWPLATGICPDGPFTNVKPYGQRLMEWIQKPSDDFPGQPSSYQCNDNQDNDRDGLIDYPNDPGCSSETDDDEYNAPSPPTTPFSQYYEAEDMNVVSPMAIGNDADASQGHYISPTSGTNSTSPLQEATLSFTVPQTDTYYLWVRMYGPDSSSDALYVGIDTTWDRVYPGETETYEWVKVENVHKSGNYGFSLTQGSHMLRIGHGEINARADALFITTDPDKVPSIMHPPLVDNAPPGPPTELRVQ